jgi:hypothetical protein
MMLKCLIYAEGWLQVGLGLNFRSLRGAEMGLKRAQEGVTMADHGGLYIFWHQLVSSKC